MTVSYAKIVATGGCLPDHVMHNRDLEEMVDTTDRWIFSRTGIRQRHIAAVDETVCDLAERAAKQAMEQSDIAPKQIDLIIVATTTPEKIFPSTACLLQQRLGIEHCPAAFDVQAVCAGFVYALAIADQFIRAGTSKCALVVGAEVMSRLLNWEDRSTCILFGDGAGAAIVQAASEPGVMTVHLHADGRHSQLLHAPGGAGQSGKNEDEQGNGLRMLGREVYRLAVNFSGQVIDEALQASGLDKSDVDWLVPHQANIRILSSMARRLSLPMARVVSTVEQHGNTSAASIPLALNIAMRDGRIKPEHNVLLVGFGGGFAWGAILVRM